MEGWIENIISEICFLGRGRVISGDEISKNIGIYPVYSSQTANNGEMGKINTYDFEGEYVTWTTDGANAGTVFFREGKYNCTNVCGTLKNKNEDIDLLFLSYLLSTIAKSFVSYIGNPKLMNNVVAKIPIKHPKSLPEQKKIAQILSTIDQAIDQTQKLITKYKRIKTGLMQDLLTKGIDKNGNIRTEKTHKFKDSPIGRIPEEWEVKTLEECTNPKTTITYGIVQTGNHVVDGIPVLRTVDLLNFELNDLKKLLRTTKEISDKFSRTILKEGDIVCNVRASVGDFNIIPKNYEGINTTRGVARISPKKSIDSHFLLWFLNTERNERQMDLLIKGTTFIDINIADLRLIKITLPKTINEQKKISEILNNTIKNIKTEQNYLSKLQKQKTGLMQDLLTGKVRVTELIEKEKNN